MQGTQPNLSSISRAIQALVPIVLLNYQTGLCGRPPYFMLSVILKEAVEINTNDGHEQSENSSLDIASHKHLS